MHLFFQTSILAVAALQLSSCGEESDYTQSDPRRVTTLDGGGKVDATDEQRFFGGEVKATTPEIAAQQPIESDFTSEAPDGWIKQPTTQFRLLNYSFGPDGEAEAYLSLVQGQPLDNINRWMNQFDAPEITVGDMNGLPEVRLFGNRAKVVEARGAYKGMGRGAVKADWALLGVVGVYSGQLATVKVLGPPDVLSAQRAEILQWASSIAAAE